MIGFHDAAQISIQLVIISWILGDWRTILSMEKKEKEMYSTSLGWEAEFESPGAAL
jgi:hypothetical protein